MSRRIVPTVTMALLAGWLWMQPPLDGSPAFIKQWEHVHSYDEARRCEAAIATHYKRLITDNAPAHEITQAMNSRCIPADYIYTPPYRLLP